MPEVRVMDSAQRILLLTTLKGEHRQKKQKVSNYMIKKIGSAQRKEEHTL